MTPTDYMLLLAGMAVVTYLPRCLPLLMLSRIRIPGELVRWLEMVPVALLTALVVPLLIGPSSSQQTVTAYSPELLAALPTLLIALRFRSLGGTVFAGMVIYLCIKEIFL